MNATTFDTLKTAKRLKEVGLSDAQAEAVTDAIRDARDGVDLSQLATKADLSELKADTFKWIVPLLLGQAALIAALVKLL